MAKRSDFNIEQTIFLGGQISAKHPLFKLARMSPDHAEMYAILDELPKLMKLKDPIELAKRFIEVFGMIDLLRHMTELTILSAIMGDTRRTYSMKPDD